MAVRTPSSQPIPDRLHVRFPRWFVPFTKPAGVKSAAGGRGASKSHQFAQLAVLRMSGNAIGYPVKPLRIASARDYATRLDESVKTLVEHYIRHHGLWDEFDVRKTYIDHPGTDSHMFFPGVTRSAQGFLSVEGLDIFWMEQAEALQNEMYLIEPSLREALVEQWYSWNPNERTDWCWQRFAINPEPDDVRAWLDWRNNPWWDETNLERMRVRYQQNDPDQYDWMWGGQPNDAGTSYTILPHAMVEACVEAFREGLAPDPSAGGLTHAGMDWAQGGGNKCSLTIRRGPTILHVVEWPGVVGDLSQGAQRAYQEAAPYGVSRLYYDGSAPARTDLRAAGFRSVRPVWFNGEVQGKDEEYERGQLNKDTFDYRNIQMAEILRQRASNTVRLRNGDKTVNRDRCLFINPDIPNLAAFMAQLSQPRRRSTGHGRWSLDKRGMTVDGVQGDSPDSFDSSCLSFARDNRQPGRQGQSIGVGR